EVGAAALTRRAGEHRRDRGLESQVAVGHDELDARQAAGDQTAQERRPGRAVFRRADVHPEDLAVTVGVDASGDEHAGGGDAAAFADPHRPRIAPHEGVRRAVQRPGSPCLDDLVKVGADPADLAPADAVDAHRPRHVIDAAGRYALDVALRYDGAQRLFRPPAGVEEAREVAARPQLGDAQLHRARAGVPVAVAVAVALRGPLVRGAFAVRGADLGGDLRLHQRLGQHTHALAQEVDVAALG